MAVLAIEFPPSTMAQTMQTTTTTNATAPMACADEKPELTTDDVMLKIDELVQLSQYLKRVAKPMLRKIAKRKAPRKDASSTTRRNGFAVPVTMKGQLITFLNTAFPNNNNGGAYTVDTVLPRTEVTQLVTKYIKDNNLQLAENRKNFSMDAPLATAFGVDAGTISNWFELQKYLAAIIVSAKQADAAAAPPPPAATTTPAATSPKAEDAKPTKRVKKAAGA